MPKGVRTPSAAHAVPGAWAFDEPPPDNIAGPLTNPQYKWSLIENARYWNQRAAAVSREMMGPNYPPTPLLQAGASVVPSTLQCDLSTIWRGAEGTTVAPRTASPQVTVSPNPHPYSSGLKRPEGQRHLPAPDPQYYFPSAQPVPTHYFQPYCQQWAVVPPPAQDVPVMEPYIEVVPEPKGPPPLGTLPPEIGDRWWKCTSERSIKSELKSLFQARQMMEAEQAKLHPYSGVDTTRIKAELKEAADLEAQTAAAADATKVALAHETLSVVPLSLRPHIQALLPALNPVPAPPPPAPEIPDAVPGKSSFFEREATRVQQEAAVEAAVAASKALPPPVVAPPAGWIPPPPTIDESITLAVNAEMTRILGKPFEAPPAPPPPTTWEGAIAEGVRGEMSRILGRAVGPAEAPGSTTFVGTIAEVVQAEMRKALPYGLPAAPEAPTWEGAVAAAVQSEVSKIFGVPPSAPPPPKPTTWEGAIAAAVQSEVSKITGVTATTPHEETLTSVVQREISRIYGLPPPPGPQSPWEAAVAQAVEREVSRQPSLHLTASRYANPASQHSLCGAELPVHQRSVFGRGARSHLPRRAFRSADTCDDEYALQQLLSESQCVVGGRDLLRKLPRRAPSPIRRVRIANDDREPNPEEESYIFDGDELQAALERAVSDGDDELHCVVRKEQSRACGAAGGWVRMQRREGPTRHALGCAAPPPIEVSGGAEAALPVSKPARTTGATGAAVSAFMGLRDQAARRELLSQRQPLTYGSEPLPQQQPHTAVTPTAVLPNAVPPNAVPAKRTPVLSSATLLARKRAAAAATSEAPPPPTEAPPAKGGSTLQNFFKERRAQMEEEKRQEGAAVPTAAAVAGPDSVPPPGRKLMGDDVPVLPL